jgi:Derlin-2/3
MFDILEGAPATRILTFISIILSIISATHLASGLDYFYSPRMILEFKQYWRLFTSFLYFGDFSFQMLLRLFSFVQYSATLESKVFIGKPEDFIIFLVFGWIAFLTFGRLLCTPFLSDYLFSYVLYYWAKHFGDEHIRILTLPMDIPVQYMPVISLIIDFFQNGPRRCFSVMLSFIIAHLFFFIRDVVGIQYNKVLLRAPNWLQRVVLPLKSVN